MTGTLNSAPFLIERGIQAIVDEKSNLLVDIVTQVGTDLKPDAIVGGPGSRKAGTKAVVRKESLNSREIE